MNLDAKSLAPQLSLLVCALFLLCSPASTKPAKTKCKYPDMVRVGAYLMSIHDINLHEREYTVRFWLWMKYKCPDFQFDKRVEIPNAKSLEKPDTLIEVFGDTTTLVSLKMKAVMKEEWNVAHFPFGRETLTVQIENTKYGTDSLIFVQDSSGQFFDRNDSISVTGWNLDTVFTSIDNHLYETNFGDTSQDKTTLYSRYNIHIVISREPSGLFSKLFLGMYLSFLIALLGFCIPIRDEIGPRFEIPIGALIAVVGNKYIIEPLLPEASAFTLVDILHIITLGGIMLIILISTISLHIFHKKNKPELSRAVDFTGAAAILALYVAINALLVFLARYPADWSALSLIKLAIVKMEPWIRFI